MKKNKVNWIFISAMVVSIILGRFVMELIEKEPLDFLVAVGVALIIIVPVGLWRIHYIKI